ncbi:PQQ-dependent sugar dehydrogenase [Gaiella sp.]|uniref:PQQ-dependent sugar dehydrogenase n=1 Tax=Gaiella sp. TaxID=2663207 RepID=UPI002E319F13|nr:PQQ-dependent sugar dehydrogenase [Gaiella sp.]HEX5585158.1 PQQ-dependent sugar dehydrogenase [Gaiella sp.]
MPSFIANRPIRVITIAVAAGLALAVSRGGEAGGATGGPKVTVKVVAKDFSFTLSRRSVPKGAQVTFRVRNAGAVVHDFAIAGKRTRLLRPGQSATLRVRFTKKGPKRYVCSVPGHARLGMKGVLGVATTPPPPPAPPATPPPVVVSDSVRLTKLGDFERPVLVTAPPGDTRDVFVVEQPGRIRVVHDGELLPQPFLDIRDQVYITNEPGLLSLVFAPDWATSGLAYVYYNQRKGNGDTRLAELRSAAANPLVADTGTLRTVLEIVKPWENHNGGMLQFGLDGDLYLSTGDGDSGVKNKPGAFAQTLDDLLGSIIRIDPRHGSPYAIPPGNPFVGVSGARPELWAYGLRNPWRFWIDSQTGDMVIGDVGYGSREELDVIPSGTSGQNFGWPCFEGTLPFDGSVHCDNPVAPILELPHDPGDCSIIAGVVVRDPRLPALAGRFLIGDYCTGVVEADRIEGGHVVDRDSLGVIVPQLSSFGVDGLGRVYLTSTAGPVYRLDPA